jgi:homoisocitrate dehydrogenase
VPKLCVIPGDGIGKEVIPAAVEVLQAVTSDLEIVSAEAGWECFKKTGSSVPEATLSAIRTCGSALFGAVSSPSRKVEGYRSAIITMRQSLNLYANIRPVKSLPGVSPRKDIDMIIVRENTEGLYSGIERGTQEKAVAERVITRKASANIASRAMELASLLGRSRLTIVHKANILPVTDGLFRDTCREVVKQFAQDGFSIEVDELLVDVAALKIISDPKIFDVLVTTNLFGDILSDAAAHWCGGLEMAPSLNWGDNIAVAEPVHGSAPDIAEKGIANPIAAILSGALLVQYIWGQPEVAKNIRKAVNQTLLQNIGNPFSTSAPLPTRQITDSILNFLRE